MTLCHSGTACPPGLSSHHGETTLDTRLAGPSAHSWPQRLSDTTATLKKAPEKTGSPVLPGGTDSVVQPPGPPVPRRPRRVSCSPAPTCWSPPRLFVHPPFLLQTVTASAACATTIFWHIKDQQPIKIQARCSCRSWPADTLRKHGEGTVVKLAPTLKRINYEPLVLAVRRLQPELSVRSHPVTPAFGDCRATSHSPPEHQLSPLYKMAATQASKGLATALAHRAEPATDEYSLSII